MVNFFRLLLKNRTSSIQKNSESGMTLIEILIVLAIIAMIATFVGTNVSGQLKKARVDSTKTQIRNLGTVLETYQLDCGAFPTTSQGLQALITKPDGDACENYNPSGYLKSKVLPKDGWGTTLVYESDGSSYVVKSLGKDRKEGGDGENTDISSETL